MIITIKKVTFTECYRFAVICLGLLNNTGYSKLNSILLIYRTSIFTLNCFDFCEIQSLQKVSQRYFFDLIREAVMYTNMTDKKGNTI